MPSRPYRIFGWRAPEEEANFGDAPVDRFAAAPPRPEPIRAEPAPKVERTNRQRTILRGKIVFGLAARSLDCVIRDLSDTGAKVRLAGAETLPKIVWLVDASRGLAFEAEVIWTRERDLGLKFIQRRELSEEHSPEFKTLRQLWLECLPR